MEICYLNLVISHANLTFWTEGDATEKVMRSPKLIGVISWEVEGGAIGWVKGSSKSRGIILLGVSRQSINYISGYLVFCPGMG